MKNKQNEPHNDLALSTGIALIEQFAYYVNILDICYSDSEYCSGTELLLDYLALKDTQPEEAAELLDKLTYNVAQLHYCDLGHNHNDDGEPLNVAKFKELKGFYNTLITWIE